MLFRSLRTFFEKTDKDTSVYFRDKKICSCGKKYRDYQGKYPVIFITFKDVKFDSWEKTFEAIRELFTKEAYRHIELRTSKQCDDYDKKIFERFLAGDMNEVELSGALMNMSRMLHKHYGVAPIIIIDEYDIPIQQGYMKNYYDKVILLMRNLFSGGFKDNKHLSYGFLTGILRPGRCPPASGRCCLGAGPPRRPCGRPAPSGPAPAPVFIIYTDYDELLYIVWRLGESAFCGKQQY